MLANIKKTKATNWVQAKPVSSTSGTSYRKSSCRFPYFFPFIVPLNLVNLFPPFRKIFNTKNFRRTCASSIFRPRLTLPATPPPQAPSLRPHPCRYRHWRRHCPWRWQGSYRVGRKYNIPRQSRYRCYPWWLFAAIRRGWRGAYRQYV
jgi:hypothetical protein